MAPICQSITTVPSGVKEEPLRMMPLLFECNHTHILIIGPSICQSDDSDVLFFSCSVDFTGKRWRQGRRNPPIISYFESTRMPTAIGSRRATIRSVQNENIPTTLSLSPFKTNSYINKSIASVQCVAWFGAVALTSLPARLSIAVLGDFPHLPPWFVSPESE